MPLQHQVTSGKLNCYPKELSRTVVVGGSTKNVTPTEWRKENSGVRLKISLLYRRKSSRRGGNLCKPSIPGTRNLHSQEVLEHRRLAGSSGYCCSFWSPTQKRRKPNSNLTIIEPSAADADSESPSDGTSSNNWTSTSEEPCFIEAEQGPSTSLAESTICGAESTPTLTREEPLPSTSSLSSTPRPQVKCSRKMMDKSVSEESSNLMHTIGQTLGRLTSQEENNDAIHTYCKNTEHRMRKLPPHLLQYFQHEVDNCLFKYLVDQSLASETSDRQFTHL
ncbi:uncharacterized protein LOC121895750 [Thunnus maccoyii]|uniref:uncharacterized protein LOC121895750 n=1 Tax=Thunnus maccoyii TaxID=8240 RepID=UPI001C4C4CDE|nr:uncharacterized protein LOC121895750 [Thunnus maccoyii]